MKIYLNLNIKLNLRQLKWYLFKNNLLNMSNLLLNYHFLHWNWLLLRKISCCLLLRRILGTFKEIYILLLENLRFWIKMAVRNWSFDWWDTYLSLYHITWLITYLSYKIIQKVDGQRFNISYEKDKWLNRIREERYLSRWRFSSKSNSSQS